MCCADNAAGADLGREARRESVAWQWPQERGLACGVKGSGVRSRSNRTAEDRRLPGLRSGSRCACAGGHGRAQPWRILSATFVCGLRGRRCARLATHAVKRYVPSTLAWPIDVMHFDLRPAIAGCPARHALMHEAPTSEGGLSGRLRFVADVRCGQTILRLRSIRPMRNKPAPKIPSAAGSGTSVGGRLPSSSTA